MSILTISRQIGSFGDEIAETLARRQDWVLITRSQLIDRFFAQSASERDRHLLNESPKHFLNISQDGLTYLDILIRSLTEMARKQSVVLVGFGSQVIFADDPEALHIRIEAPVKTRISRIRKQYHVSEEEAASILETADKKHKRFVSVVYGVNSSDSSLYHMSLNTAQLSADECVSAILSMHKERELRLRLERENCASKSEDHQCDVPIFKNAAEAEFARILDMYQIEWQYEPKTFPVEWDAEGNVTLAFSPDFYLTKFDTYIELTIMNQKYVTEKNKKIKKLRELYPGTNVRIVYKKDFHSLIERFNGGGN